MIYIAQHRRYGVKEWFPVVGASEGAALVKQLKYMILGRTRLRIAGRPDDRWGEPKLRAMLGALLLQPRRAVPIDELAEWIWPEDKIPKSPQTTFYTYANRIRIALDLVAEPPQLVNTGGAYRLDVDREEIDLFHFRQTVERARLMIREGELERASRSIEGAMDLWVDQPLSDLCGDRARNWRLSVEADDWIPAVDALAHALVRLGRFDDVLRRIADLPVEHQSNLTLVKRRLEVLRGLHRNREATTYYIAMRKRFLANFDHDEADELTRFYDELSTRTRAAAIASPATHTRLTPEPPSLRHDISDFVGREDLLERLDSMVARSTGAVTGVIVLHGAPGVGKTALAVHWAHRIADRSTDSTLFLELDGFIDGPKVKPDAAVDQLLSKLGVPARRIPTPAGRATKLRNILSGQRALIVLDNARDSAHVAPLIDCLSSSLVVITSRRALTGLGRWGAVNISVWPLPDDKCLAWLSRRLPERAGSDPNGVALLAEQCGGIPLALRLVAEHIAARPHVPINEFIDELRDIHALIGLGDDGDGPDGSVRAAFSYSYRELSEDEQRVFRLLGVHPGPDISLEAAAALFGQGLAYAKRNLDVLVNANLATQPESRSRYRLHDLLRTYAAERAAASAHTTERSAAEDRMLAFYLHTANHADRIVFPLQPRNEMPPLPDSVEPLEFSDDQTAMDWCTRERANLNAVIAYAGNRALHRYASLLPSATGEIFKRFGHSEDVAAAFTIALRSCQTSGDLLGEANSLYNLGVVHLDSRDFTKAESYLTAARDRYGKINSDLGLAGVAHRMAQLYIERGEVQRGIDSHIAALTVLRNLDDKAPAIIVLRRLAEAYRRKGDLDAAHSYCSDALWRAEQIGSIHIEGACLSELGAIYVEQGDLRSAKGALLRALPMHERTRDVIMAANTCYNIALIDQKLGTPADSVRWARRAIVQFTTVRDDRGVAMAQTALAEALYALGQRAAAIQRWTDALTIFDDLADPQGNEIRARLAATRG